MENASKALIIAGAILLAILLISLGIMIYTQASGVVNNNAMSEVEISSFNKKFTQYGSSNVRGSQVNALIDAIVQNNLSNAQDTSRQVKLKQSAGDDYWSTGTARLTAETAITSVSSCPSALSGKTYKINYKTDPKTGLITTIEINEPTASGTPSGTP